MKKNQKRLLAVAIVIAMSPLYAAEYTSAISETETNDTIDTSNYLGSSNLLDVSPAAIGVVGATQTIMLPSGPITVLATTEDVDFYSFYANAGDDITVDIDYGIGGQQNVDTLIGLFDSNRTLVDTDDDTTTLDSGSIDLRDARIDHYIAQTSGIYYVGVSSDQRQFYDGGSVDVYPAGAGDYELIITKVSPSVSTTSTATTTTTTISSTSGTTTTTSNTATSASAVQYIDLEIRPGSRDFTPINPNANGVIPVALLSKKGFNAMDIDPSSVTFGAKGTESSLTRCNSLGQDVNGDGLPDMLCFFNNQATRFKADSLQGYARGKTRTGTSFEGHGITKVKIVGRKAKSN